MTFTNKAAAEMAERVEKLVGGLSIAKPVISTFHSFCVRVLRRDIEALRIPSTVPGQPAIGLTKNFVIYDESDQQQVIESRRYYRIRRQLFIKVFTEEMSWHQRNFDAALWAFGDRHEPGPEQVPDGPGSCGGKRDGVAAGPTDEAAEGQWVWVDGQNMTYANWEPLGNQPNNKRGEEHFLMLRYIADGKWCDQPDISTEGAAGFHLPMGLRGNHDDFRMSHLMAPRQVH